MARWSVIILITIFASSFSVGQDSTARNSCSPSKEALDHLAAIMWEMSFDSIKQYGAPEAYIVSGKRYEHLASVLRGNERAAVIHENSTRKPVWMHIEGNDADDALYVVLKTSGAQPEDVRYHSLVLYKKPAVGWQIYLWHVGT